MDFHAQHICLKSKLQFHTGGRIVAGSKAFADQRTA
jgi:hypothetical protein